MRKFTFLLALLAFASHLFSQWSTNPNINNTVSSADGQQRSVLSCVDGSGGVIIAWADHPLQKLYVQRINSSGQTVWTSGGIAIGNLEVNSSFYIRKLNAYICSDAGGGAVIVWKNSEGGIYAQRVRSDGVLLWTSGGLRVSSESHNDALQVRCIGAEAGYTILGWFDGADIFTQKLDAYGTRLWDTNDVRVSFQQSSIPNNFDMCKDAKNGAYFSYSMIDTNYVGLYYDIFVQHINTYGSAVWGTSQKVTSVAGGQFYPSMCEDQNYGFIVSWTDERSGYGWDIYAARLDSNGDNQWTNNGEPMCTTDADQTYSTCISDAHSGAHITWIEDRFTIGQYGYYLMSIGAQNVSHEGEVQWGSNGKVFSGSVDIERTPDYRNSPPISCVDALGGLIVCWVNGNGIVAQRFEYGGDSLWGPGVLVAQGEAMFSPSLISDGGASGCIIAWAQIRDTLSMDIYAQHVKSNSDLGNRPGSNSSLIPVTSHVKQNYPNPFNPATNISFNISQSGFVSLKIYDMTGREVAVLADGTYEPGEYSVTWNAANFATGAYLYKFTANGNTEIKTMMLIK